MKGGTVMHYTELFEMTLEGKGFIVYMPAAPPGNIPEGLLSNTPMLQGGSMTFVCLERQ